MGVFNILMQAKSLGRASILFAWFATSLTLAAESNVEQRIQRIQDGLLPPVLVEGESTKTKLSDRMAEWRVPGVSVAVIHEGKIEWARGFGVTRIDGPPVSSETLFQAASISKPVTALAVLHLVQSGQLDLDADVNQYLKSWKIPANSITNRSKVTLRQLLTHTAGMTVHGFPGYSSDAQLPTLIQVLDGQAPANSSAIRVDSPPGTNWRYSGGGYVVVQQLLEDVTGKSFDKLMRESVLEPIGMSRSTYEQPLRSSRMAEAALPYHANGTPVKGGPHVYPEKAPAGLWTTPTDLARYAIDVQQSLANKSNKVISASMAREMVTPGLNSHGIGPHIGGNAGQLYFEHNGANDGYQCALLAYENGDGAIVMTNSDNGGRLASEILRTIAYEYKWPDLVPPTRRIAKVDPAHFDALAGVYQLSPTFALIFTRVGNRLISEAIGQQPLEVFPESENVFFTKAVDARFTFSVDESGKATQLVLHQNGRDRTGKRLDEAAVRSFEVSLAVSNKSSEDALRRLLGGLAANKPDYDDMTPVLAELTRQQLPELHASITRLGSLVSINFKGVGADGFRFFSVVHEHGIGEWRIVLNPEGKIGGAGFQVAQ